jgi:hypothetical protein
MAVDPMNHGKIDLSKNFDHLCDPKCSASPYNSFFNNTMDIGVRFGEDLASRTSISKI